ncbi:MAG: NTP-binding protein [Betaproteobacteria bacterium HGW-Betaproteobacteria-11]|nr:MAG: NTP-binding protein [Betaproteobacteria bacterium HGW-Betaproteobacteria-11]
MIRVSGNRIEVSGPLMMATAGAVLAAGEQALAAMKETETEFDLKAVEQMDSAGLAVIFGWVRTARAAGKSLHITHPPQNLLSLAAVYGVVEFLP